MKRYDVSPGDYVHVAYRESATAYGTDSIMGEVSATDPVEGIMVRHTDWWIAWEDITSLSRQEWEEMQPEEGVASEAQGDLSSYHQHYGHSLQS